MGAGVVKVAQWELVPPILPGTAAGAHPGHLWEEDLSRTMSRAGAPCKAPRKAGELALTHFEKALSQSVSLVFKWRTIKAPLLFIRISSPQHRREMCFKNKPHPPKGVSKKLKLMLKGQCLVNWGPCRLKPCLT